MKKKVYISGAIAHYDLKERMATFDHAARYLSIKGYEPVNPFENGIFARCSLDGAHESGHCPAFEV